MTAHRVHITHDERRSTTRQLRGQLLPAWAWAESVAMTDGLMVELWQGALYTSYIELLGLWAVESLLHLFSDMTYYVSSGTKNSTHSLTPKALSVIQPASAAAARLLCARQLRRPSLLKIPP